MTFRISRHLPRTVRVEGPRKAWNRSLSDSAILCHLTQRSDREVNHAHFDILPEAPYAYLECLLKNTRTGSSCFRAPWIF
jgi:hypothetical protein